MPDTPQGSAARCPDCGQAAEDHIAALCRLQPKGSAAHRLAVEHSGHRFEWRVDGVYLDGEKVPGATTLGANERGPIIEFGPWGASQAAKDMLREVGWNV